MAGQIELILTEEFMKSYKRLPENIKSLNKAYDYMLKLFRSDKKAVKED